MPTGSVHMPSGSVVIDFLGLQDGSVIRAEKRRAVNPGRLMELKRNLGNLQENLRNLLLFFILHIQRIFCKVDSHRPRADAARMR